MLIDEWSLAFVYLNSTPKNFACFKSLEDLDQSIAHSICSDYPQTIEFDAIIFQEVGTILFLLCSLNSQKQLHLLSS